MSRQCKVAFLSRRASDTTGLQRFGLGVNPKVCNLIADADSPDALEWERINGGPLPNNGLLDRYRAIVIATAYEG